MRHLCLYTLVICIINLRQQLYNTDVGKPMQYNELLQKEALLESTYMQHIFYQDQHQTYSYFKNNWGWEESGFFGIEKTILYEPSTTDRLAAMVNTACCNKHHSWNSLQLVKTTLKPYNLKNTTNHLAAIERNAWGVGMSASQAQGRVKIQTWYSGWWLRLMIMMMVEINEYEWWCLRSWW